MKNPSINIEINTKLTFWGWFERLPHHTRIYYAELARKDIIYLQYLVFIMWKINE